MVAQYPEPGSHVTNARLFNSTMDKDQTTTPGTTCPTLYVKCVVSLTSPTNQNNEDAGDGAYGLSSLSERTRISNHLQTSLQRQTRQVFPEAVFNHYPGVKKTLSIY